jgi:hypothetical protein
LRFGFAFRGHGFAFKFSRSGFRVDGGGKLIFIVRRIFVTGKCEGLRRRAIVCGVFCTPFVPPLRG